jgi:hypothetical protein
VSTFPQVKVAFMGSHYLADVQATHEFNTQLQNNGSSAEWHAFTLASSPDFFSNQISGIAKYQL